MIRDPCVPKPEPEEGTMMCQGLTIIADNSSQSSTAGSCMRQIRAGLFQICAALLQRERRGFFHRERVYRRHEAKVVGR